MTFVAVVAGAFAMALMVNAAVGRRRLSWRAPRCPVCHRPIACCTCHWL